MVKLLNIGLLSRCTVNRIARAEMEGVHARVSITQNLTLYFKNSLSAMLTHLTFEVMEEDEPPALWNVFKMN